MSREEGKAQRVVVESIPSEETFGTAIEVILDDSAVFGKRVLDYLGIRGERRREAERIIGKGDKQAERLSMLLTAEEMREEKNWRRITFGLGLGGLLVAIFSGCVAFLSLIVSVIVSLSTG